MPTKNEHDNIQDLAVAILTAAASNWLTYFLVKRAVRKRGGPEWAAYGFAKLALLIQAPITAKKLNLEPEQMRPAIEKFIESRAK